MLSFCDLVNKQQPHKLGCLFQILFHPLSYTEFLTEFFKALCLWSISFHRKIESIFFQINKNYWEKIVTVTYSQTWIIPEFILHFQLFFPNLDLEKLKWKASGWILLSSLFFLFKIKLFDEIATSYVVWLCFLGRFRTSATDNPCPTAKKINVHDFVPPKVGYLKRDKVDRMQFKLFANSFSILFQPITSKTGKEEKQHLFLLFKI